MADFNVRSDSVNVEQIMEQIRTRIREKRGVDYTEQQIHELAAVKLEKFLDPKGIRSDLLDEFRKAQPAYEPPELPNYAFEESTLFESHRAPIRWMRKLLAPFLKLLFNPNPLIQALNIQARLNTMNAEREARREAARRGLDQLYYELIHNLVLEATRTGIEVKNLKMRLESVSSRLEFNERRARALEGAVVYKSAAEETPAPAPQRAPAPQQSYQQPRSQQPPPYSRPSPPPSPSPVVAVPASTGAAASSTTGAPAPTGTGAPGEGPGQRSRRRRRRRGRRGGGTAAGVMGAPGSSGPAGQGGPPSGNIPETGHMESPDDFDGPDEGGDDEESSAAPRHDAPAHVSHDLMETHAAAPLPETVAPAASIAAPSTPPAESAQAAASTASHVAEETDVRESEHRGHHHATAQAPAEAAPAATPAPAVSDAAAHRQADTTPGHGGSDTDPQ